MSGIVAPVAIAAAGVVQVREVELVDTPGLRKVEQRWQVRRVVHGQGEAQADLHVSVSLRNDFDKDVVARSLRPYGTELGEFGYYDIVFKDIE